MSFHHWTQKIFAWADEFKMPEYEIPRDKEKLLAMTELDINREDDDKNHLVYITYLPNEIAQLNNLIKLDVWDNQLSQLPDKIGQLSQLTELDISFNPINTLP